MSSGSEYPGAGPVRRLSVDEIEAIAPMIRPPRSRVYDHRARYNAWLDRQ